MIKYKSMARRWTGEEEREHRERLIRLYIIENKPIGDIGEELGIAYQTVFDRLKRLGITTNPEKKSHYLNRDRTIRIPSRRSVHLAEFFGIMLGDGHLSLTQVMVTLGSKELDYVRYVSRLMQNLFGKQAHISVRSGGYRTTYISSVELARWLQEEGLVQHKVRAQVDAPSWIFTNPKFMESFLRGFFDTDGSVYKLRFGTQISFTNRSRPLLDSLHRMLTALRYKPSVVTKGRIYLTRQQDIERFFSELRPANIKHLRRYNEIKGVGTQAVNEGRL